MPNISFLIPSIFITWHSVARKSFPFFPIYLLINFYGFIDVCFIQGVIICYLLWCSDCLRFGQWSPFTRAPVSFWQSPSIFECFCASGTIRSSCPRSRNHSRALVLFWWRSVFKNQELTTRCIHWYCSVVAFISSSSQN